MAEFQNGVLKLSLAKLEEAKPRRIEVNALGTGAKQVNAKSQSA